MAGLSISNTEAGQMTNVQLLPDTNQLGATTNYAVYFTIANELPSGSYVDITFPQSYHNRDNKALDSVACAAVRTASAQTTCSVVSTVDPASGVTSPGNVVRI